MGVNWTDLGWSLREKQWGGKVHRGQQPKGVVSKGVTDGWVLTCLSSNGQSFFKVKKIILQQDVLQELEGIR